MPLSTGKGKIHRFNFLQDSLLKCQFGFALINIVMVIYSEIITKQNQHNRKGENKNSTISVWSQTQSPAVGYHIQQGFTKPETSGFQGYSIFNLASFPPENQMWGPRSGIYFTPATLGHTVTNCLVPPLARFYRVATHRGVCPS